MSGRAGLAAIARVSAVKRILDPVIRRPIRDSGAGVAQAVIRPQASVQSERLAMFGSLGASGAR